MTMDWNTLIGYWPFVLGMLATGVVSGVAAGLLGIGGGAVIVPALSNALLLMGFDAERGALDINVLKLWAPFIVAGTFIGGLMAGWYSGDVLRIVFAVMAFVIAANIVFSFQTKLMGHLHESKPTHRIAALIVGYLSSLMGIGGGSLRLDRACTRRSGHRPRSVSPSRCRARWASSFQVGVLTTCRR